MLRPTVRRPSCLGINHPSGAYDQIFYCCQTVVGLLMWGALSDERTGLSFSIATGPRQRSQSRVRFTWNSRPYFTVSNLRLPFSAPLTTRRVTALPHGSNRIEITASKSSSFTVCLFVVPETCVNFVAMLRFLQASLSPWIRVLESRCLAMDVSAVLP
jgi:hypothetical protein